MKRITCTTGTALAALCLAGCGTATVTSTTTTAKSGSPTTTSSSVPATTAPATTAPAPAPATTVAPARTTWSTRTITELPFESTQPVLPAGSGAAYLLRQSSTAPSAPEHLTAVNLTDGTVQPGPQVNGDSFLLTSAGKLYVVSPAGFAAGGQPRAPWSLRPVAPGSMALGRAVSLGDLGNSYGTTSSDASFQPSGPSAGDLWAFANGHLELVDPSSGKVSKALAVPGSTGQSSPFVATEPDGRYVDVALLTSSSSTAGEVVEFDAATGAVVATHDRIYAVGTPGLATVPGGVWASYRGGMDGTAVHLAEPSLRDDTPPATGPPDQTKPVPGRTTPMGELVSYVGTVALISDSFGVGCMSPSGTAVVSSAPFPGGTWSSVGHSWTAFAGTGHTVYALSFPANGGGSQALLSVTVPDAC